MPRPVKNPVLAAHRRAIRLKKQERMRQKPLIDAFVPMTRTMFLYVMVAESGLVKVGVSHDPERRAKELMIGGLTIQVYAREAVDRQDPLEIEREAHRRLRQHRVRGEWFSCHPEAALAVVRAVAFAADDG